MQEKMKVKYNKKRNTAFLYETLVKELTKSIVNKDDGRKKEKIEIAKELKLDGISIEKIVKYTGLTKDEIEGL